MQTLSTLTRFEKPALTAERWREKDAEVEAWERAERERAAAQRVLASGIPPEFRGADVTDPRVAGWLLSPGYGLLLKGRPGRGKTHQACAALKALALAGSVRFVSADDMVRECAQARRAGETPQECVNALTAPRALVIDDLGKEEDRWNAVQTVFAVIDRRGQKMRPTIVTTNLDGKALLARYAESNPATANAIISRLSRYTVVEVEGEDRRRA